MTHKNASRTSAAPTRVFLNEPGSPFRFEQRRHEAACRWLCDGKRSEIPFWNTRQMREIRPVVSDGLGISLRSAIAFAILIPTALDINPLHEIIAAKAKRYLLAVSVQWAGRFFPAAPNYLANGNRTTSPRTPALLGKIAPVQWGNIKGGWYHFFYELFGA